MDTVPVRPYRLFALTCALLAACGGGGSGAPQMVSIGGKVSGLHGKGLVLTDNGGDALPVSSNATFVFPTQVEAGSSYRVGVKTQPSSPSQLCQVAQSGGTAGTSDVTTVSVTCKDSFALGGMANGMAYVGSVKLSDGASDDITLTKDGPFEFPALAAGTAYSVSVAGSAGTKCTVGNGSGVVTNSDITNVTFTCPPGVYYKGEITVSGLTGSGLAFSVEGGGTLAVSQDGTYPFPPGADGTAMFFVTSLPSNPKQLCTIGISSVVSGSNVLFEYPVSCSPYVYTLSGAVTGLQGSGLTLTYTSYNAALNNNVTDNVTVQANGAFAFDLPLASAETYSVTVATQPTNPTQSCIVQNAAGAMPSANVNSLKVICAAPGTVSDACSRHSQRRRFRSRF